MTRNLAECPGCGALLPEAEVRAGGRLICAACRSEQYLAIFPNALAEQFPGEVPELPAAENDSRCYFHAEAPARHICDACGRLLCRICALPLSQEVICPSCLDARLRADPQAARLRTDRLTLALALLPFTFGWSAVPLLLVEPRIGFGMWVGVVLAVSLLTAPMAITGALRSWRKVRSFTGNPRLRLTLTLLIAIPQVLAWVGGTALLLSMLLTQGGLFP